MRIDGKEKLMKAKRLFAILLTLAMVLTYMPALAFADVETAGDPGTPAAEDLQTEVPEAETEPQTDAVTFRGFPTRA